MDTFDGSKPNLINGKTLRDIELQLDVPFAEEDNRVINGLGTFYRNYIEPNMFPIIVIMLLVLYLTIKYILKKDREEKEEEDNIKDKAIERTKDKMLKIDIDNIIKERKRGKEEYIKEEYTKEEVPLEQKKNNNKINISDHISDDYLLTESDNSVKSDNTDDMREQVNGEMGDYTQSMPMTGIITDNIMNNRDMVYDLNNVTSLVFGK